MPGVFSKAAKQLDRAEVEALYRRYAPLVHARARRLVGGEAEDVVQEVFVRLIRKPPKGDNLAAWFYTTATNVSLDRLRFRARRDPDWYEAVRAHVGTGGAASHEELLGSRDLCRRLLARMDRKTQQVVMLTVFDDMDQQAVADLLGISRKTVGERLSRFQARAQKVVRRWTS